MIPGGIPRGPLAVIPAQAGIQALGKRHWIPACAGMTGDDYIRDHVTGNHARPFRVFVLDLCAWCEHVCEGWVAGLPRLGLYPTGP